MSSRANPRVILGATLVAGVVAAVFWSAGRRGAGEEAAVEWLRSRAIALKPAADEGLADLAPLKSLMGNAAVVGLGSGPAGTQESVGMKTRIARYLVSEADFTLIAVAWPTSAEMQAVEGIVSGTWAPVQPPRMGMADLAPFLSALREFNLNPANKAAGRGVQVVAYGVPHLQEIHSRAEAIAAFVATSRRDLLDAVRAAHASIQGLRVPLRGNGQSLAAFEDAARAWTVVRDGLQEARPAGVPPAPEMQSLSDSIVQGLSLFAIPPEKYREALALRGRFMAENIAALLTRHPGRRMIVWELPLVESTRVAPGTLGGALSEQLGDGYFSLGLLFGQGRYWAHPSAPATSPEDYREKISGDYPLTPPPPGSVESVFASVLPGAFIASLRGDDAFPGAAWFRGERLMRRVTTNEASVQFFRGRLATEYDAVIWQPEATAIPSPLLMRQGGAGRGVRPPARGAASPGTQSNSSEVVPIMPLPE